MQALRWSQLTAALSPWFNWFLPKMASDRALFRGHCSHVDWSYRLLCTAPTALFASVFLPGGLWSHPLSLYCYRFVLPLSHQEPGRKCRFPLFVLRYISSLSLWTPFFLQILPGSNGSISLLFFPRLLFSSVGSESWRN